MRILLILNTPTIGGVERIVINLADGLINNGYEAEILFINESANNSNTFSNKIKCHQNKGGKLKNIVGNTQLFKNYDIIHNHTFGFIAVYVWFISLLSSKKLVTTLHSTFNLKAVQIPNNFKAGNRIFMVYKYFERWFNFLGSRIIVISPFIKLIMAKSLSFKPAKITIINNSVAAPIIKFPEIIHRNKNLVYIGRLSEEKNIDKIIAAWFDASKYATDKAWKLLIYGSGDQKVKLQKMIKDLELTDKVLLMGNTYDVYKELANCQIAITASKYEGLPLFVLESMHANLCCLASNIDAHQYLKVNEWGILFDINNHNSFTEAIIKLINNDDLRINLSNKTKRLTNDFELKKFISEHISVYKELI